VSGASWETVIGLEVHVQLHTRTKLFCACPNRFGDPPNTNVCPVCLGHPGSLPVTNGGAAALALRLCLALDCEVGDTSIFARKNYFYPDLPKGYQISQYDRPLARGGAVPLELDGERTSVPLVRIHLEEDAGKSMHDEAAGTSETRIDLNRCGTPLVEIVSEPAMQRAEQAGAYLESIRRLVRWLDVSDGDMSQGSLRCDANVSVRRPGAPLGTKTEVKNLNSIKMVERAIQVEARRQIELLEGGGHVQQATLLWDDDRGAVRVMRTKEDADDYRYFPDPDLPPLRTPPALRDSVRARLPELPFARRERFASELGLPAYDAAVLTESRPLADLFERLAGLVGDAKLASNWTMGEVMRVLKETARDAADFPLSPEALADLLVLVRDDVVSGGAAKTVFAAMLDGGGSAREIVDREGLAQVSDDGALLSWVTDVVQAYPEQGAQFRDGNEKVVGFLVGAIMKASGGKANPQRARELLVEQLRAAE
jgi:aspartyl-tRNA(Asn)/glutamyl-tRNA(Gln) amidotransferase subunit B